MTDVQKEISDVRRAQLRAANKRWRDANKEKIAGNRREYRKTEEFSKWRAAYFSNPEVKEKERARQRRQKATDAAKMKAAEWQRNRRANSSLRTLCHRMSAMVSYHLNARGKSKGGKSWQSMVPYSPAELAAHIERQFVDGMSWENFGEWEIDHIVPVSSFSFSSPDDHDFKCCWALPNLRPLWRADNKSKGDKLEFMI